MRKIIVALLLCSITVLAQMSPQEKKEGFKPLFNGKNLDGWDGDPRIWKVSGGVIAGNTEGVTLEANSFLISKERYKDFIFRAEVKLRNHNSGIQFRSERLPNWVMQGLQADMAEGNWWGGIYDEKGKRGVVVNGWKGKAEKVVKATNWNEYEVLCKGDHIELRVNGLLTAEYDDTAKKPDGLLGFQVHKGPGMLVEWRNIRIKELK
jgi:hypothetical protein